MGILANENAISGGNYLISNSLRFQSASSQYLSRTPASATNQTTWTWSGWVKRGAQGTTQGIFDAYVNASNFSTFFFTASNTLYFYTGNSSPTFVDYSIQSDAVFRDSSAWYHIILVLNTTSATQADRCILYVNGVRQSVNNPDGAFAQNVTTYINSTNAHNIGRRQDGGTLFDGYMAEVNFIDGQALTPSSFGETDATSGQWVAKKYAGTYGTNGFYLPFSNGTSTTTLGYDSSGNGNNWTLTNFTRSAGVSDCWMYDVPSGNGSAGTQPNSNYAVLNPLWKGANITISAANLNFSSTGASSNTVQSTVLMSSGKWYCEWTQTNAGAQIVGIASDANTPSLSYPGQNTTSYGYSTSGNKYNNGATSYGATWTTNDVIGIAFDADAGTLTFYKNGVSQGTAFTGIPAGNYGFCFGNNPAATITGVINFGQRSFAQSVPSGYKALCTANLPASTIVKGNQYMDATLYTGNGSTQTITNAAGFSPDLVWIKIRSTTGSNVLSDVVRGTNSQLFSNLTDAEQTRSDYITAFNSNGFSLGAGSAGTGNVNSNGATFVGWQWDAGSSTVTNTSGSISSQVRANTTAGVSIVTYTGTGANATVGHGLGVAPKMIIVKQRNGTGWWIVYHSNQAASPQAGYLALQTTNAYGADSTVWNNTAPTSSVFSIGTNGAVNTNTATYVAYCFAEIAGFSKFGSYTGNGSADGTFVYLGFRPKYVMIKCTSSGTANFTWAIYDSARNEYNVMGQLLQANLSNAEAGAGTAIDFLSNGFKLRAANDGTNAASQNYIYMAFAENPFANANAR